jgi:acetyl esterase/lipase
MPLDPRARRFLQLLAATRPPSALSLTVAERRTAFASLMKFSGPAERVAAAEACTLQGPDGPIPVRVYTPAGAGPGPLPALVYFHGGGLVAGSVETHDAVSRALANASGCRLFAVDYRLGPEHRFPAAIADGYAATLQVARCARDFGVDRQRIGICGDSAGATLAAVVCQMAARSGEVQLALQLLLCPILDCGAETDSRRALAEGYLLDRATLEHDLLHYVSPGTDRADPRISPLRAADLSGLPPTCIHTAEFDPLRDEGRAYADRLAKAGVRTAYTCHPGMIHLFYGLGAVLPYARSAYELIGAELRAALT